VCGKRDGHSQTVLLVKGDTMPCKGKSAKKMHGKMMDKGSKKGKK
jgi:hypothetical protein